MAQLNLPLLGALGGVALAVAGVIALVVAVRRPLRRPVRLRLGGAGVLLALAGVAIVCGPYLGDTGLLGLVTGTVNTALPVAGWTLIAFGATFILWGLFADRSRGRRRCPRCWYSMEGIEAAVCPECGHDARHQRRMYKTRRQWRMAIGGIACIAVGYAGSLWLDIQRFGVGAVLPTPVVAAVLEVRGWPRPASVRSPDLPTAFLRRMQTAPRWVQDLARRRMARYWTIDYRPVWPAGVPIAVRPSEIHWYSAPPLGGRLEVRLLDCVDGPGRWVTLEPAFARFNNRDWSDGLVELGALPMGRHEMKLEIRLKPWDQGGIGLSSPAWSMMVSFPIQIVSTIGDVLAPVADPRLDEEIAEGFVAEDPVVGSATRLYLPRTHERQFSFELIRLVQPDVTVALKTEFLKEGRVVGTCRAWDAPGQFGSLRPGGQGISPSLVITGDQQALVDFDLKSGSWSVRITPDPELALRDFERSKYWSGTVVLPATK